MWGSVEIFPNTGVQVLLIITVCFFPFLSGRVHSGPGNPGKYLKFSLAFSRTRKSLKTIGGPGKSWKFVNSST